MYQIVQDYLEQSQYARNPEELRDAVSAVIALMDFHSFAFLALGKTPFLISSYPIAWTGHYIAQDYQRRDPVMLISQQVTDLFMWSSEFAKQFGPLAEDFFYEAEAFDIRSGVTVPVLDWPGGLAAMTFATDRRQPKLTTCVDCNQTVLLFIALHFKNNLRLMLEPTRVIEGAELTPREYKILGWAAQGKSNVDTAQILNVSARLVARDIENLRRKLGVRSINQAVAVYAAHLATRNREFHQAQE